jgi:DNA-binding Xre family transcriptional regulator
MIIDKEKYFFCLGERMKRADIFSLYELAYLADISIFKLSKIYDNETDRIYPSVAKRLCETLRCSESDLIKKQGEYDHFQHYSYRLKNVKEEGIVYFVKALSGSIENLVKIGFSSNLRERLKSIKREHKTDLEVVDYIATNDAPTLEGVLHNIFREKRVTGEWFNLTNEDIDLIKGR